MIIAVCIPLMARVHQNAQQAGEMVVCDATSSLDRVNRFRTLLLFDCYCTALAVTTFLTHSNLVQDHICVK